ncbi:hypothetical protein ACVIGB_000339 [Bradyrhizobium sp. USDA 4341]
MRAIVVAILIVGLHSCFAMAEVPYIVEKDSYYSQIVNGISISVGELPDRYMGWNKNSKHVSISVKIDRSILSDKRATLRLLNQVSLWVDEQLVMQGVTRPSLTVIRVNSRGSNMGFIAVRNGLSEPWWVDGHDWPTGRRPLKD